MWGDFIFLKLTEALRWRSDAGSEPLSIFIVSLWLKSSVLRFCGHLLCLQWCHVTFVMMSCDVFVELLLVQHLLWDVSSSQRLCMFELRSVAQILCCVSIILKTFISLCCVVMQAASLTVDLCGEEQEAGFCAVSNVAVHTDWWETQKIISVWSSHEDVTSHHQPSFCVFVCLSGFWMYSPTVCLWEAFGPLKVFCIVKVRWPRMILLGASWSLQSTGDLWSRLKLCLHMASSTGLSTKDTSRHHSRQLTEVLLRVWSSVLLCVCCSQMSQVRGCVCLWALSTRRYMCGHVVMEKVSVRWRVHRSLLWEMWGFISTARLPHTTQWFTFTIMIKHFSTTQILSVI